MASDLRTEWARQTGIRFPRDEKKKLGKKPGQPRWTTKKKHKTSLSLRKKP